MCQADHINIFKLGADNETEEVRNLRAEFELRAKNLGIVGEESVAQKVAIWEGMRLDKQIGDDIGVSILFSLFLGSYSRIVADMGG